MRKSIAIAAVAAFALASAPGSVRADTTAVYASPGGKFSMVVEIAANGDLRGDVAAEPGTYFIRKAGHGYLVKTVEGRPVVDRVEDIAQVMAALFKERIANNPDTRRQLSALHALSATARAGHPGALVEGGQVTINGRPGIAYYLRSAVQPAQARPVFVISHDPALAPVGAALAGQYDMVNQITAASLGDLPPAFIEVSKLMHSGAALLFAGAELARVSAAPISTSEFELPAQPESRADLRKRLEASSSPGSIAAF